MPWHIEKDDDEWVVIKDKDGKVVGRHKTREKAKKQLAALHASEETWRRPK